jgi:hypothetical protein
MWLAGREKLDWGKGVCRLGAAAIMNMKKKRKMEATHLRFDAAANHPREGRTSIEYIDLPGIIGHNQDLC